jgi:hypothetical protein
LGLQVLIASETSPMAGEVMTILDLGKVCPFNASA